MQNRSSILQQLPQPDEAAQALSRQLQADIHAEIAAKGPMTFARYMELALYAPGLGYYRSGSHKFGRQGDFITAPELSPLFSQCVARQCQQILDYFPGSDLLEFGAGSGVMARVILQSLAQNGALPAHYYILELSAELRQRQQRELKKYVPELLPRVIWLNQLPTHPFRGVILANEVLDAMPVHRFGYCQGLREYYVVTKNGALAWELGPFSSTQLQQQVEEWGIEFPDGYSSEINAFLPGWIAGLDTVLEAGLILLMDYGLTRREYYHPDRTCGTLMCHYRHRAHTDPFWWPGLQDLTAQVDFTAVAAAAGALDVQGYTIQAAFLLNCGILEDAHSDLSREIQRLTMPGEMGEAFKAMALTRHYPESLLGFKTLNQLERL